MFHARPLIRDLDGDFPSLPLDLRDVLEPRKAERELKLREDALDKCLDARLPPNRERVHVSTPH